MANISTRKILPHELHCGIWQVEHPPDFLYARGTDSAFELFQQLPDFGLAVVGTREPQGRSIRLAQSWIRDLSGSGLIILSGLARGIDAVAHSAALDAGLKTIAILGSGLNYIYPPENRALAHRIIENGGLIVSEFEVDFKPQPHHFIQRNRLIAGWARATWVVEAPQQSGALSTARHARDQGRTTYATPCFPGDPALTGNQGLIDFHAAVPLFGTHSLGYSWPELSTRSRKAARRKMLTRPIFDGEISESEALARYVHRLTTENGGANVDLLLDWAIAKGWSPENFFSVLQQALTKELIFDHGGTLVSKPSQ